MEESLNQKVEQPRKYEMTSKRFKDRWRAFIAPSTRIHIATNEFYGRNFRESDFTRTRAKWGKSDVHTIVPVGETRA